MKHIKKLLSVLTIVLLLSLCACGKPVILESPESKITNLASVMTAEEIAGLDQYENLQYLDLSGSTCYDAILNYISTHPNVKVIYSVELDGHQLDSGVSSIDFINAENYWELISVSKYLKHLDAVDLGETDMTLEQIEELRAAFPNAKVEYEVSILGEKVSIDTTELDFAGLGVDEIRAQFASMRLLPALERVNLVSEDGSCALDLDTFISVANEFPELFFEYEFDLFGQHVSTSMEELRYDKVPIGNAGVEQFRKVMPYMKNLSFLLLDCCGVSHYELLGQLNEDFPDTEVVWRVRIGEYDCLTNAEMIWLNSGVNDYMTDPLKYCTKCRYIDMGHCDITHIEFCRNMPDLEVAIFALSRLNSIEPLRNCTKLEYLEIYATEVSDLSPLENCKDLQHINFGSLYTIKDISPLYGLTKLKRVRSASSGVPIEQQYEIMELLPDCDCSFDMGQSSGGTWRRNPDGTWSERYALLRQQFKYDNHEGVSRTYKYDLYVD